MNLMENVYFKETKSKGKSLFASKDFKKGQAILVLCGPIVKIPSAFTVPITPNLYIDPILPGRYLCHSCEPNAGIKSRTVVTAFKDIKKDDEILIDYAMIVNEYGNMQTEEELICQCGSRNCRGRLGSWDRLPENLKEKYQEFTSENVLEISSK